MKRLRLNQKIKDQFSKRTPSLSKFPTKVTSDIQPRPPLEVRSARIGLRRESVRPGELLETIRSVHTGKRRLPAAEPKSLAPSQHG